MYRLTITEIHEDGREEIIHDDKSCGFFAIVESEDGERFAEIVQHQNLLGMASKIAQSENVKRAAALASTVEKFMGKMQGEDAENSLLSQILGGTDLQ